MLKSFKPVLVVARKLCLAYTPIVRGLFSYTYKIRQMRGSPPGAPELLSLNASRCGNHFVVRSHLDAGHSRWPIALQLIE